MARSVSIGTAYSEAASFVRREKKLLAPLVLALMVVPATVSQLVQPGDPFSGSQGLQPWMAIAALALLAGLVGQMAISRLALGWHGSLGETIILALKRLPTVLGAFLLFFLSLSLVLIPVIVVLTLLGGGASGAKLANVIALLAIFGVAPRILLAPAIAMDRPLGPWRLIRETWRATAGQYWRLLGFFLLFLAASLIVAVAASSVVGTLATLAIGSPSPMSVSRLIMALTGGLVQAIVATVYAAMIGRIVAQLLDRSTSGT